VSAWRSEARYLALTLMKMTLSSVLYSLFRKLLTEAVRLLQIFAKLREFEIRQN